jgi:SAM-dependent methyltransferase
MELYRRKVCPVCQSEQGRFILRKKYSDPDLKNYIVDYYDLQGRKLLDEYDAMLGAGLYELTECLICNLIYQVWSPTETLQKVIYSKWIDEKNSSSGTGSALGFEAAKHNISEALKLTKFLMNLLAAKNSTELRILDFGMGQGGLALAMKACGCDVFGYDFSNIRQENAARLGIKILDLEAIRTEKFAFINTEQVLEHVPDAHGIAKILSNALVPAGVLKISVPFNRWLEKGNYTIDWSAGRYEKHSPIPNAPLEHLQYFRRPSLDVLGKNLGLKRVKIPAKLHLEFSTEWSSPKVASRNVGRMLLLDWFRNYYLFQKLG